MTKNRFTINNAYSLKFLFFSRALSLCLSHAHTHTTRLYIFQSSRIVYFECVI
jgi:hypothetical protein